MMDWQWTCGRYPVITLHGSKMTNEDKLTIVGLFDKNDIVKSDVGDSNKEIEVTPLEFTWNGYKYKYVQNQGWQTEGAVSYTHLTLPTKA